MIKVFEAFAGYGSQSMALRRLGIDFEVVGISEIDKYAIQAYMAVHGDTPNYGDISKIDWKSVPDFDFLTYSFPCTDISTAGEQKGLAEGSGTRSSLLWECRKAIEAKRPKYLLMENVKNLVSKKFTPYLKEWLRFLEGQGYSNYTKVLNAKDFGVPQNRERVFMVSILCEASFHFPKPFTLEKRLKDVLEKDVDESFYLSEKIVKTFLARNEKNKAKADSRECDNYVYVVGNTNPSGHRMNGNVFDSNGLCPTLTTNKGEGSRILESVPTGFSSKGKKYGNKRVQSLVDSGKISGHEVKFLDAYNQTVSDICGTIKTIVDSSCLSFISEPINQALIIKQATKKGYIEIPPGGVFDASYPESLTRRGRVQDNGNVSPTLTAGGEPPCLYEGMEPKCVAYTRNCKGKVISRRLTDIANTVHGSTGSGGSTDCFVAEPQVLTPKRTEYGKAMRKDYETGAIKESRHNMTQLEPRTDGVSNTITTVQKDNLLVEPGELSDNATKRLNDICIESEKEIIGISVHPNSRKLEFKGAESITAISPALRATDYKCPHAVWEQKAQIEYKGKKLNEGDDLYLSTSQDFFRGGLDGISRTPKATNSDTGVVQNYRIRKLTPRECFRLMGVSEKDIDNIQKSGISKTQQYKMAGNSIVVDVLYYIFKKMFVDKSCEDAQLSLF